MPADRDGIRLDDLTDEELIGLHETFLRLVSTGPIAGFRAAAACLNEVDQRLSDRGRLDLRTGVIADAR